jgi:lipopolysaccharide transport system ATP-binding protein
MGSITVKDLGKRYKHYPSQWARLIEWCSLGRRKYHLERRIIQGLSFSIRAGESVGIIGQNGAGKSTLLKILTGTTQPTEGERVVTGSLAALLELGMGFHPEFSGRQNIRMGCQLKGLSNVEIDQLMTPIIEFAELAHCIDQPLKTYSSGMQMRLAFSVATATRPDILIVDEALSVGDAYFQHKSMARIREFRDLGTTLLFVSHDPTAVKSLCDRALLLDDGVLIKDGKPDQILDYYNAIIAKREKDEEIKQHETLNGERVTRSGNKKVEITKVELLNGDKKTARAFLVGESCTLKITYQKHAVIEDSTVGILIRDRLGNDVFGTNTYHLEEPLPDAAGIYIVEFAIKLSLGVGNYSVTVAAHTRDNHISDNHDWWDQALVLQIVPDNSAPFIGVAHLPITVQQHTIENR